MWQSMFMMAMKWRINLPKGVFNLLLTKDKHLTLREQIKNNFNFFFTMNAMKNLQFYYKIRANKLKVSFQALII